MPEFLRPPLDINDRDIAPVFDELSFWSSRFGHLLFDHLPLQTGIDILDVACGLGFPLFELAHVFGPASRVTGIDCWSAALDRARQRLGVYGLPNVTLVEGDATRMPFQPGSFDLIVSNLGINNFADPDALIDECFRVARPGARFALTTNVRGHFDELYQVFRPLVRIHERSDWIDALERNEAHRGTPEKWAGLLEKHGFQVTRRIEDRFTWRFADGSTLLRHFIVRVGFLEGWRAVVGPGHEVEIFTELERRLNILAVEQGELRMTVPMLYLEARRPRPEDARTAPGSAP